MSVWIRRHLLIRLIAAATLAWSAGIQAQPTNMPVIGFLSGASPEAFAHLVEAFRDGLTQTGFEEGKNVQIDFRWAEGDYDLLPVLASELVRREVMVILASGGDRPTLAAKAATSTIPIVFSGSDDPVRFGLVDSLSKPGGNVTGASLFTSVVEIKKLELLHEVLPAARRIGMLVNPNNPPAETDAEEIEAAFAAFDAQALDGLLIGHDPFFNSQRAQIVGLATQLDVPAVYEHREFVLIGGLMSYGNPIDENYRLAGRYVGRILKGAKPADLPVQQATKFELLINLKTAAALDLDFPPSVLIRADEIIE